MPRHELPHGIAEENGPITRNIQFFLFYQLENNELKCRSFYDKVDVHFGKTRMVERLTGIPDKEVR